MKGIKAALVAGVLFTAVPGTSHAFTFSVGPDFWDNELGSGYGFNIYPGWDLPMGVRFELMIGFHNAPQEVLGKKFNLVYVPLQAGVRWDSSEVISLGPVAPFVGFHYGYAGVQAFGDDVGVGGVGGGSNNMGFSTVAGSMLKITDGFAIGAQAGVDIIQNAAGNVRIISASGMMTF